MSPGEDVGTYTVQVFAINALFGLDESATKRDCSTQQRVASLDTEN